jgi:hypothetical protein
VGVARYLLCCLFLGSRAQLDINPMPAPVANRAPSDIDNPSGTCEGSAGPASGPIPAAIDIAAQLNSKGRKNPTPKKTPTANVRPAILRRRELRRLPLC